MLLMMIVMLLSVFLNNIVAAAIGLIFNFAHIPVLAAYVLMQQKALTSPSVDSVVNIFYWLVPHPW